MTRGIAGFVRDNLEAFAVAIAMALVIRHFCIEAFRIPTKSMKPTLLGDQPPNSGDRILVDKLVYMRRDPRRYEVVVFQFPLNRARNYIKRLVGLPGEWLRIVDGDIWTTRDGGERWQIERKPDGAQDQLFFPYYPIPYGEGARTRFPPTGNWEAGDGWLVSERDRRFKVDAAAEGTTLRFARRLLPYGAVDTGESRPGTAWQPNKPWVGDARVSFVVEVERAGTLVVRIQEHGRPHRLELGPDESAAIVATDDGEHRFPIDVTLASGEEVEISFANVDDRLIVEIDGDRVLDRAFPDAPAQPPDIEVPDFGHAAKRPHWDHEIAIVATRLKATLRDVAIDRDIYYNANGAQGQTWRIPDGHYFMLGDNTRQSSDSRRWLRAEAELNDGTVIRWQEPDDASEPNFNPYADDMMPGRDEELVVAIDVEGLVRRFNAKDLAEPPSSEIPSPYVPRDHLVGRAFAIFWPIHIPRLVTGPTRVNLIR